MAKTKEESQDIAEIEFRRLQQAAQLDPSKNQEMLSSIWYLGATKLGLAPGDVTSRTAYYGGSFDAVHLCLNTIERLMSPDADRILAGEAVDEGDAALKVLSNLVRILTVKSFILEAELAE